MKQVVKSPYIMMHCDGFLGAEMCQLDFGIWDMECVAVVAYERGGRG